MSVKNSKKKSISWAEFRVSGKFEYAVRSVMNASGMILYHAVKAYGNTIQHDTDQDPFTVVVPDMPVTIDSGATHYTHTPVCYSLLILYVHTDPYIQSPVLLTYEIQL